MSFSLMSGGHDVDPWRRLPLHFCILFLAQSYAYSLQGDKGFGLLETERVKDILDEQTVAVLGDGNQHLSSCLSIGGATVIAAIALFCLQRHTEACPVQQAARSVYLLLTFVLVCNYTIVILDSYDLSKALGLSQAASGKLVGVYMLGACIGAAGVWLLLRAQPLLWSQNPRSPLVLGLLCQLTGSMLFSGVAAKATFGFGNPDSQDTLGLLLMTSRCVSGIGSGACQQFFVSCMLHLTPVSERAEHTTRWVLTGMLSLGLGPPIAAALQALNVGEPHPRFDLVGYVQVVAVLTALYAVLQLHPDLAGAKDCLEPDEEFPGSRPVVMGCLLMTGLRSFSVSAIEVAIALKLEKTYEWDQRLTGVTVGAIFLGCIPLRLLHVNCSKRLSTQGWIRLFGALSVLGSLLLSASVCRLLGFDRNSDLRAALLITGGLLLFPCLYLSDALGSGLMHQHVLPEGSPLDANHTQLWFMLSQGVGRFLGPWLARLTLDLWGQDCFAAQQAAATCTFLLFFELVVRPFLNPCPPALELDGDDPFARQTSPM